MKIKDLPYIEEFYNREPTNCPNDNEFFKKEFSLEDECKVLGFKKAHNKKIAVIACKDSIIEIWIWPQDKRIDRVYRYDKTKHNLSSFKLMILGKIENFIPDEFEEDNKK